ncbi:MAG: hypothetical protein GY757_34805 [bacterium]|nr:hypothetical protein [bacterium]
MNSKKQLTVKLIHCGNRNITEAADNVEKYVFWLPMGLFSLAAELKRNGNDVEMIHLDLETGKNIAEILDIETVDAVGFDMHWANQAVNVLQTAESIKRIKPSVHVFLGGYTAGFFAGRILQAYPRVDTIIRGDGEKPIVELCKALQQNLTEQEKDAERKKPALAKVPNLAWRETDQKIAVNELTYASTAAEMDGFDFSDMSLLRNWEHYRDLSRYWTNFSPINSQPLFILEIGRGCIYNCSICGGNSLAQVCLSNRKGQAVRSVDAVIASVKQSQTFGYSCFFTCFDFEGYEEWYTRFFNRLKQEKIKIDFTYECWGIPSPELVDVMCDSCENVIMAISPDTASYELRTRNKDTRLTYTNQQLEECLEHIRTRNNARVQLWFGYYLPGDNSETVMETMDYIARLYREYAHIIEITYMNVNTDPASSLYFNPGQYEMDLEVQSFDDYTTKIRENYIEKKAKGMTLLSKPTELADKEAVDLANKIVLFNQLFYYRESILTILTKTEHNVITRYLKQIDMTRANEKNFCRERIKSILTEIHDREAGEEDQFNLALDGESQRVSRNTAFNTPQYYRVKSGTHVFSRIDEKETEKFDDGFDFC